MSAMFFAMTMFGCEGWFSRPPAPPDAGWVPTLLHDFPAGEVLEAGDVAWLALPLDMIPDGIPRTPEEFVGRRAVARLLRHEILRSERLGPGPGQWGHVGWFVPRPDFAIKPEEEKVFAIVAARDMAPRTVVGETDLYAVRVPPRFLPEGVFLSPELVVGTTVCEQVLAHEYVRVERVASDGETCPSSP